MKHKKRGYYTAEIGGKQRTLHFSFNFWANLTECLQVPLEELGQIFESGISMSTIRALIFSGLKAYDQEEGNVVDYNEFTVGVWLEEFDANKINEMVETMMTSKILGNPLNMGIPRTAKTKDKKEKKKAV